VGELLGERALQRLRHLNADHLYGDDPEWFELTAQEFGDGQERFLELATDHVRKQTLRTFHGTRIADARSFFECGIRLHDRRALEAEVRELLDRREGLTWLKSTLDQRFADTAHLIDEGRCFVVVDERFLVEECGHYLLGGSEFVQGIIGPREVQMLLRESAPTVIEVDLPLNAVRPSQVTEFTKDLIGEWARVFRRVQCDARRLDFTFCLREPVPPAWIAGHYHPPVVHDPHSLRRPIRIENPRCAACACTSE
jgi:hypothetical protein